MSPAPRQEQDPHASAARKGSFLHSLKAVAWAFFGVRQAGEYEKDVSQLNPMHVIAAGIVAALVFIGVLIAIVRWVVG